MSEAVAHAQAKHKEGVGDFIRKTRAELDKTTFPSASDVKSTTLIVLVSVVFFAAYLWGIDRFWWLLVATTDGPIDGRGLVVWLIEKIVGA